MSVDNDFVGERQALLGDRWWQSEPSLLRSGRGMDAADQEEDCWTGLRVVKHMRKCLCWIKFLVFSALSLGATLWPAMQVTHWLLKEDPLTLSELWASYSFEFCVIWILMAFLCGVVIVSGTQLRAAFKEARAVRRRQRQSIVI